MKVQSILLNIVQNWARETGSCAPKLSHSPFVINCSALSHSGAQPGCYVWKPSQKCTGFFTGRNSHNVKSPNNSNSPAIQSPPRLPQRTNPLPQARSFSWRVDPTVAPRSPAAQTATPFCPRPLQNPQKFFKFPLTSNSGNLKNFWGFCKGFRPSEQHFR